MTTHTYEHGTAEITGYEGPWRFHVYRPFKVHPKEPWNAAVRERVMSDGHDDVSPSVMTYDYGAAAHALPYFRKYSSECSCCYLHISHTVQLHDKRTGGAR